MLHEPHITSRPYPADDDVDLCDAQNAPVTRRELALLLPLLALYVAAWAFFPERPDDEASYVVLAERSTDGLLRHRRRRRHPGRGSGKPGPLVRARAAGAPRAARRGRRAAVRARLTSAFVLFAAVLLMYVLARERWGPRVGLVAAYALGLYVPFLGLLSNLHSEVLAVLFVVVGMLGLARFLERGGLGLARARRRRLGGPRADARRVRLGADGRLARAPRVVARAPDAATASRSGRRSRSRSPSACPWLAYTYAKTDRLFVWGNSGSLSLYWMTSPYEGDLGDWHQAHLVFTDPDLQPHRAFFEALRGLDLAEQNAEIEREALRNIADHPGAYAENVVANVSRMLFNSPYSRTLQQTNDVFYALPNAILLGAAVLCAFVLVPRRRALPPETGAFALLGGDRVRAARARRRRTRGCSRRSSRSLVWLTALALVEAGLLRSSARTRYTSPEPKLLRQLRRVALVHAVELREEVVERLSAERVDDDVGAVARARSCRGARRRRRPSRSR